jgi:hypothetical protein
VEPAQERLTALSACTHYTKTNKQTKMNKLQSLCHEYQTSLTKLTTFGELYGDALEGCVIDCIIYNFGCDPEITLKDPAKVGCVFGKEGWTRKASYYKDSYTWTRTVTGITLTIPRAELIPPPDERPVLPREFPIQLEDSNAPQH